MLDDFWAYVISVWHCFCLAILGYIFLEWSQHPLRKSKEVPVEITNHVSKQEVNVPILEDPSSLIPHGEEMNSLHQTLATLQACDQNSAYWLLKATILEGLFIT